jgi:hypothetical protein
MEMVKEGRERGKRRFGGEIRWTVEVQRGREVCSVYGGGIRGIGGVDSCRKDRCSECIGPGDGKAWRCRWMVNGIRGEIIRSVRKVIFGRRVVMIENLVELAGIEQRHSD